MHGSLAHVHAMQSNEIGPHARAGAGAGVIGGLLLSALLIAWSMVHALGIPAFHLAIASQILGYGPDAAIFGIVTGALVIIGAMTILGATVGAASAFAGRLDGAIVEGAAAVFGLIVWLFLIRLPLEETGAYTPIIKADWMLPLIFTACGACIGALYVGSRDVAEANA